MERRERGLRVEQRQTVSWRYGIVAFDGDEKWDGPDSTLCKAGTCLLVVPHKAVKIKMFGGAVTPKLLRPRERRVTRSSASGS